jgi:hypothetical protein
MDSKKLRQQYLEVLPQLEKTLSMVHEQLRHLPKSDFIFELNRKPIKSIYRKVRDDKLDHVTQMSDLVRGRIFFSARYNYNDVIALINKLLMGWIKDIEVKFNQGNGLEYHGVYHIDLEIDGIKFELQIMPIEFKPFKEFLHKIYEQFRDSESQLSDEEKEKLRNINNKLYEVLDQKARANRRKIHSISL